MNYKSVETFCRTLTLAQSMPIVWLVMSRPGCGDHIKRFGICFLDVTVTDEMDKTSNWWFSFASMVRDFLPGLLYPVYLERRGHFRDDSAPSHVA